MKILASNLVAQESGERVNGDVYVTVLAATDKVPWRRKISGTTQHFTLLFYPQTATKCTENYNSRAQSFYYSLNLLFNAIALLLWLSVNSLMRS